MGGIVDYLQKHILGICKTLDFKSRAKIMEMDWKGGTTAPMETNPVQAVDSPLTASGISTPVSASMSSCVSKKRGMNQMTDYKESQFKSLKALY